MLVEAELSKLHILKIHPLLSRSYSWKILTSSPTKIPNISIFSATLVTCRWEDNIMMDFQEMGLGAGSMGRINLA